MVEDFHKMSPAEINAFIANLDHECVTLAKRLQYVLDRTPMPEGVYMFPDGDSWDAGVLTRIRTSAPGKPCNAVLANGHTCCRMTCDHSWEDPIKVERNDRLGKSTKALKTSAAPHERFLADVKSFTEREKRFEVLPLPENINPGISGLVAKLNAAGWKTTDSGDGITKNFACDRGYPYVVILTKPEHLFYESLRVVKFFENQGFEVFNGFEELTGPSLQQVSVEAGIIVVGDVGWIDISLPMNSPLLEESHAVGAQAP